MSVNDIVKSTSSSNKTVYRIAEALNKKKVVTSHGDRGIQFLPSTDLHAAALKRYVLSNEHPLDAIIGSKLLVLLAISHFPKSVKRIAKETKLKQDTVRVLVWSLRNYGVVTQKESKIMISSTDVFMAQFLQDFSKGVNIKIVEMKTKFGILLWSGGLECIFSTPSLDDSTGIQKTCISAMANYGLQFVSETNYYYYSYWHPDLRTEDVAIHNLLIDPYSTRGISYSMLLLKKTGFDSKYLLREARSVGINKLVKEIIDFVSSRKTTNPFLPSRIDIDDLYRQYGVQ
ncbi:MAG: hypothetical protein NT137_03710 [Methanomassiliicoccales archaeon]|nr:hypothetical protein [Methanomassiliicoccales archaeon]